MAKLVIANSDRVKGGKYVGHKHFKGKFTSISGLMPAQAERVAKYAFGEHFEGISVDESDRTWIVVLNKYDEDSNKVDIGEIKRFKSFWNSRENYPWKIKVIENYK